MKFSTIVLAADREGENPVAKAANAPCKVMVPVAGKPMLQRILAALDECPVIEEIVLGGPAEEIWRGISFTKSLDKPCEWITPDTSPSRSAWRCIERIETQRPVLLTTADIAFPSSQVFTEFCRRAIDREADVAVGLVPYRDVVERFPGVRRTPLKFADGPFCTCNLFAFLTPKGRELILAWRKLEQDRKRPWRLIRVLGLLPLLRYLARRLTTDEIARHVKRKLQIKVAFIRLPFPEAAIDVDTVEDLNFVRKLLDQPD